jgi:hypothetical protein
MSKDKFKEICSNMTKKEGNVISDFLAENEL